MILGIGIMFYTKGPPVAGVLVTVYPMHPGPVAGLTSVGDWVSSLELEPGSPTTDRARPKSSTLALPFGVTMMLPGLRSLWTIP